MKISFLPYLQFADNTTLNLGTGGDVIASDDIGGAKFQRVKLVHGTDGVNAGDVSSSNGLPIQGAQSALSSAAWTSATALNAAQSINITNMNTVTVALVQGTTITGGQITFEVSPDNANWFTVQMARVDSYTVESVYALVASTNRAWSTSVDGFTFFRVRLSTAITGTATVTVLITAQVFAIEPIISVGQSAAANLQATVTQQSLTKGTQGATGITTQDLKDAGRNPIMVTASVVSTATGETLITVTISKGLASTTTGSSNAITSGKKFRIQAIIASARNSTGTVTSNVTIKLRAAVGGATSTSSPLQLTSTVNLPASAASTLFPTIIIPDGFEIDSNAGTNTWGLTITHPQWVTGTQVATFDITLIGYEY